MKGLYAGRIVHYVIKLDKYIYIHRPAIVVDATTPAPGETDDPGIATLHVFMVDQASSHAILVVRFGVPYDKDRNDGTWHFIEDEERAEPPALPDDWLHRRDDYAFFAQSLIGVGIPGDRVGEIMLEYIRQSHRPDFAKLLGRLATETSEA